MPRGPRKWRTGYVVAVACAVLGVLQVAGGEYGWSTWASVALAPVYAAAAATARRYDTAHRLARGWRPDPTPWTTQPSRIAAWFAAGRGVARHPGDPGRAPTTSPTAIKDRIGAGLAGAAAAVGLTLVLVDHDRHDHGPPTDLSSAVTRVGDRPAGGPG